MTDTNPQAADVPNLGALRERTGGEGAVQAVSGLAGVGRGSREGSSTPRSTTPPPPSSSSTPQLASLLAGAGL